MKIGGKLPRKVANDTVYPCGTCGKRGMRNSSQRQKCEYWTSKRCSNTEGRLMSGMNYKCGRYGDGIDNEKDKKIEKSK